MLAVINHGLFQLGECDRRDELDRRHSDQTGHLALTSSARSSWCAASPISMRSRARGWRCGRRATRRSAAQASGVDIDARAAHRVHAQRRSIWGAAACSTRISVGIVTPDAFYLEPRPSSRCPCWSWAGWTACRARCSASCVLSTIIQILRWMENGVPLGETTLCDPERHSGDRHRRRDDRHPHVPAGGDHGNPRGSGWPFSAFRERRRRCRAAED